jgi:hypothetical protein
METPMRQSVVIGFFALTCALVSARPADAQAGFIRWLEKLSGPGPFVGAGLEIYGLCYAAEKDSITAPEPAATEPRRWFFDVNCARAARDRQRLTIGVQFSKMIGDNNLQYDASVPDDLHDTVGATALLGSADLTVARPLDLGVGVGFLHFTGGLPGSFTRFALEPLRVTWKPLAMRPAADSSDRMGLYKREWLQIRLVMTVIPGGFDAEDFGAIPGSYRSGTEVQANMYLIVNAANLLGW